MFDSRDGAHCFHALSLPRYQKSQKIDQSGVTSEKISNKVTSQILQHDDYQNPPSKQLLKTSIKSSIPLDGTIPEEVPIQDTAGKSRLMDPSGPALDHVAGRLLKEYAENGCTVDTGPNWSMEQILTALERGPHQSAYAEGAPAFLQQETAEKVEHKFAKLVKWGDIKSNLPPNFKLSPVAMVPHKSKLFRVILDLTFQLKRKDGTLWESVNSATTKHARQESMSQLGSVVRRLVATMADHYDPNKPFAFSKLDIKDGFWRLAVNDSDAWNFCYVLPQEGGYDDLDDTLIVVPNCLQMGWTESPPYFCSASETARDVIQVLLPNADELPKHALEDLMMPTSPLASKPATASNFNSQSTKSSAGSDDDMSISDDEDENGMDMAADTIHSSQTPFATLLEVFVDDFIAGTNNISEENLRLISRAMLHGIHSVFPPPSVTGHNGGDSVSIKKIEKGEGKWEFAKDILGWMINGLDYTIQLPDKKCKKVVAQLTKMAKKTQVKLKDLEKLVGTLQHASLAMPGGWGLFSPLTMAMKGKPKRVKITPIVRQTLLDWRTIIRQIAQNPTHVLQLVDGYPDYIGYSDACKLGAGGVWFGVTEDIGYHVWRMEFPKDLQDELCTSDNPNGKLTMNDFELAGVLIEWLVLEHLVDDLQFKHVGMNCDNSVSVTWTNKYRTSKSIAAARLLRLLCLRMHKRQTSPSLVIGVKGDDNGMADVASRSFKRGHAFHNHASLTDCFNSAFPLPQNRSWKEFQIPSELFSRVISCVRGEASSMGSLLRLKGIGKNTGSTGKSIAAPGKRAQFWTMRPTLNASSSLQPLLHGSGQVSTVEAAKLRFKPLQKRSRPSPRPSNWQENQARSTEGTKSTYSLLSALSKV